MPARKIVIMPLPITEDWDWQLNAACRGIDSTLFFHPDNERGETRNRRIRAAKRVCRTCPVLEACLRYALQADERYGTWGGLSEDELRILLRRKTTLDKFNTVSQMSSLSMMLEHSAP
ncbi:WhiB family transcriptional regulator [Rhodococcus opacus]|nr:WhiB family transcriptional regulator [Rhodococcus sp. A14]RKM76358.1 WhiB family transcriptional regulator [Rhodococcus opacus]